MKNIYPLLFATATFIIGSNWTAIGQPPPPSSNCTNPSAVTFFTEDFNACELPTGWENNILSGDSAWWFVLNSPDPGNAGNIDGTCMALFDDDWNGSGAPASIVELISPTIDLSIYTGVNLTFDFNFQDFVGETFYVDAWDGTTWNNLMTITGVDSLGTWTLGPPYPVGEFSLAGYTNNDFMVKFGFNDNGGNWGWYIGIDNVELCGVPSGDCAIASFTSSISDLTVDYTDQSIGTIVDWNWSFGDGVGTSTVQNPSYTYGGSGTYDVTLIVTDDTGCMDTIVNSVTVVEPIPCAEAAFSTNISDLTVNFTDLSTGTIVDWDWSFGFGSASSSLQNPTYNYSFPGTYTVTLIVTDDNGCMDTVSNSVTVVEPVACTDAAFSSSSNDLVVDFTDLSTETVVSWNWSFGDGSGTSTIQNPSYTYGASGTYDVTLIVTDDNGCSDTIVNSITVTDSGCDIPTPIITPSGPFNFCPGDSVVLTVTNLPAGSGPTVSGSLTTLFDGGNGFDGNMFDVMPAVDITVDDFDVNTDLAGSEDIVEVYYKVGTHVGSEANAADWTLLGSTTVISAGPGNPTNLGLSLGLALTAGQTYAFYLTSLGNIGFDYTDGTAVGNVLATNADVTIYEGTGKEYPFAQSFTPRNWNGTMYYSVPGNSNYSILWSPTGDTTLTTVAYGGTYTVTVDSVGCVATSDPVEVNVSPGVTAAFTSGAIGLTVNFTDLSTGNIVDWDWSFGFGSASSSLQNPTYNYSFPGTYDVTLIVTDDAGCMDTVMSSITVSAGCNITSTVAGAQTACDPLTNTYTQEIIVTYSNGPGSGDLVVNGQAFAVTSSPQTVVLTGLDSDGAPVDVDASFSADPSCTDSETALFTAPSACTVSTCPGGTTLIWEDFNDCLMPADWSTNLVNGVDDWQFGDNGGVDNIDGSCMAYFDDDIIGSAASPNWVQLFSPVVDASSGDNLQLSFDFNYNHIGADSFYVDVWNGASWDNIMLLTSDSIGFWNGGPYPTAVIPMSSYANADFQVRFSYNDGGSWAWYVGIDNVALCTLPVGGCEITSATAGTQTPCDPATSTYDQEVIIEYTSAPATGTLDVNGESFAITGSPQTVTFTGLPADGLPVDMSVSFSDDPFCIADFIEVWQAPADCYDPCSGNTTLLWENFNGCALPAGWTSNTNLGVEPWLFDDNGGNNLDGSCMAYFDDDAIGSAASPNWVELITPAVDNSSGDNLQLTFDFNYNWIGADSFYVDVWNGASWDNVMLLTSDSIGTWASGPPYAFADIALAGYSNSDFQVRFTYNDGGSWAWYVGVDNVAICQIPTGACEITAATAGTQSPCDPATSTYDQDVIIEYTSAPAGGDLIVNGQSFPITGSPQTVTFTGLPADGLPVDVDVEFSADPFCAASFTDVWTAPADCYNPCVGGTTLIWENFNDCMMPAGWSNNILTGDTAWLFGANGGDNLDGTCMAYFDDDDIGSGALPSWVELVTNTVDASSGDDMQLSFDFNYNWIGADSFYVDVWDGTQWDNVLLLTSDSIGSWFQGPPYAQAVIPLSGYTNTDFQVRFVFNDGGVWAWYVGIDNVALCAVPPTSCSIDDIEADAQGPCDPVTNEYTQDLVVTYSSDPGTGTLDINGQSFAITGSPQTVTLTGLDSDGQTVDVSANFSDDIFCAINLNELFTAPETCLPIPINDTCENAILIECGQSIIDSTIYASTYEAPVFCGTGLNTAPGMWYSFLGTGDQVSITTCSPITNYDTKLGLFEGPCDSLVCIDGNDDDFTCPNSGVQSSINNFITTPGVEYLIYVSGFGGSTGLFELTLTCSAPCEITNVTTGTQTPCDPADNTYTQEVTVEYDNPPLGGFLDINGQQFAITTSPQTETLIGLLPNGQLVDLTVQFTDNTNCTWTTLEAWTAPEDCTPPPCTDPDAETIFLEDFNLCEQPLGWENNIIAGDSAWLFVLNSPDAFNAGNIDGTCMALFDDDWNGSGAPASIVELVSPQIDLSNHTGVNLAFDFNYNDFTGETFYVDAWDGTAWNNLMTITEDSIGPWALGPPYPSAVFSLAGYSNSDFQIKFGYDDNGGNWGWYVGVDNVELCGVPDCVLPVTFSGLEFCVGEDSALVSVLEAYSDYSWSNSGSGQSQWFPAGMHSVTVTDASGCSTTVDFDVTQIDNPLPPEITITGDTVFCEGGSTILTGPAGMDGYVWNTGSLTQEIEVYDSGNYTLYVIDSTGCASATSAVNITVNPLPVASFSYTLVDFTINLTNLSLGADDYDWSFGDTFTGNQENPVHTYAEGGVYTITLVASNDCGSDTANVTLGVMNIGVEEASGISEFSMYPNPVHDRLIMDLTMIENREVNIEFFDGLGQVVMSQQNDLRVGSNKLEFDLGNLAQGVYSVKISNDGFSQIVRLVKR